MIDFILKLIFLLELYVININRINYLHQKNKYINSICEMHNIWYEKHLYFYLSLLFVQCVCIYFSSYTKFINFLHITLLFLIKYITDKKHKIIHMVLAHSYVVFLLYLIVILKSKKNFIIVPLFSFYLIRINKFYFYYSELIFFIISILAL